MPFYKFILKEGHCGKCRYREIAIYNYAKTYNQALEDALSFPAVKHNIRALLSSKEIDEDQFVNGVIKNAYQKVNYNNTVPAKLQNLNRIFSYIDDHDFETEIGKKIKQFCIQYACAVESERAKIERDYTKWAQQIIDNQYYNFEF